ncbi:MAG: aminopeptidase [Myxococcaceae bacterium]
MHRLALTFVIAALSTGCLQTRYLAQAACGQFDLMNRAEPIPIVLHRNDVSPHVREVLRQARPIKDWGKTRGLTPSDSYEKYADLHREAAVWVVQAAPRLSLTPKTWWFPFVGSVPYLGYFHEKAAHDFADKLAASQPLDVDVREADAYSTLGVLSDPVLSTMISAGPEALGDFANIILHESVHATVYVGGQSAFNESLASFVADRLTPVWLEETFGKDDERTAKWIATEQWREQRVERMLQARKELVELYGGTLSDDEKLAAKTRILDVLRSELRTKRMINNATLAGMHTYGVGKDAFSKLYETCGKAWPRFLGAISTLKNGDFPEPQSRAFEPVIDALSARGCPEHVTRE